MAPNCLFLIFLVFIGVVSSSFRNRYSDPAVRHSQSRLSSVEFNCTLNVSVISGQTCSSLATEYNITLNEFITLNPTLDCNILTATGVCVQSMELCVPSILCLNETQPARAFAALRRAQLYRRSLKLWHRLGEIDPTRSRVRSGENPPETVWSCNLDFSNCTSIRRRSFKSNLRASAYASRILSAKRLNKISSNVTNVTNVKVDLKSCDCYDYDCWYSASKCWDRRSMNESTTTTNFTVVVNGSVTVKVDCLQADCSIYDYWYYCEDCWNKGLNATTEVAVKAARNTSMRFGKELKSSVNRDYCIDYCWWCESWDCWFWCGWCFKNGTDSTTLSTEQRFAKTVTNSSDPAVRVVCTKCDCATYDCWWYCTECQGMNSTSPPEAKSANTTALAVKGDEFRDYCDYCFCGSFWCDYSCWCWKEQGNSTVDVKYEEPDVDDVGDW